MLSTALQMTLIIATVIVGVALVGFLGFRIVRSNRDLGSDADKATFETLHQVSVAAPHLAKGLTPRVPPRPASTCASCWPARRW